MIILLSGSWLTRLVNDGTETIVSNQGEYLIYEGSEPHENEALEESRLIVVR
ncbi:MAG TPA: hypothetical protein VN420_01565 [Candidatus Fimivivens sp.]|nr:hypothetical protein [Candidatus Fimivivens sp.]